MDHWPLKDRHEMIGYRGDCGSPDKFNRSSAQPIRRNKICRYGKFIILSERSLLKTKRSWPSRLRRYMRASRSPSSMWCSFFEEVAKDSCFVGGEPNNKFVRFKVDHIARTLPGPVIREWWIRTLDEVIAPYVKDRGYDWEVSVDETPFDLWSLQGEIAPPFESAAEKRWVKENKASPYTLAEKLPVNLILAPGIADR